MMLTANGCLLAAVAVVGSDRGLASFIVVVVSIP
jgi:hypothetical protein